MGGQRGSMRGWFLFTPGASNRCMTRTVCWSGAISNLEFFGKLAKGAVWA